MVAALPWVKKVDVTMSAQPARPVYADQLPMGLQKISNIVAVSSCKVKTFILAGIGCISYKLSVISILCLIPSTLPFALIKMFFLLP